MSQFTEKGWRVYAQAALAFIALFVIMTAPVLSIAGGFTRKFMASACFVLIALLSGGLKTGFGRLMITALVFCFAADLAIEYDFLWGLYTFLAAHLLFVAAFWARGIDRRYALICLAIMAALTAIVVAAFFPHISAQERIPVVAYGVVIALMMVFAGGTFGHEPARKGRVLLAGAGLFYVSDVFLGADRFVGGDFPYGYLCLTLYYSGCILLAFSADG